MACCYQAIIFRIMYLIIKNYFCSLRWTIDNIYTWCHTIFYRLLVMKSEFYQRSKISIIEKAHIFQSVFLSKGFTCIFEIKWIRTMPYYIHGINLTKPDCKLFRCP